MDATSDICYTTACSIYSLNDFDNRILWCEEHFGNIANNRWDYFSFYLSDDTVLASWTFMDEDAFVLFQLTWG